MRLVRPFAIAVAFACLMPAVPGAQMDPDRVVPNGGIFGGRLAGQDRRRVGHSGPDDQRLEVRAGRQLPCI